MKYNLKFDVAFNGYYRKIDANKFIDDLDDREVKKYVVKNCKASDIMKKVVNISSEEKSKKFNTNLCPICGNMTKCPKILDSIRNH